MKYRIEVFDLKTYDEAIFISDPIDVTELNEIIPVLLKPSMFGNTDYFRVSIISAK